MAAMKLLGLAVACYCVTGFPQEPEQKTTIFGDEQLQGEVFENLKDFDALNDAVDQAVYRLPNTTKPIHYNLLLGVNFNTQPPLPQAFSGKVEIELEATQAGVNQIVIQADELSINSVLLQLGTTEIDTSFGLEPDFHFLNIYLNTGTLNYNADNAVVYKLTIEFAAPLRDDMTGFYKSWFRNEHTDPISWIATTHFQATAARRAFPCYDEPGFKATFDITLRRPTAYKSWTVTRLQGTVDSPDMPGYEEDSFYRTPKMPTYLLAFIVAEYDSLPVYNDANQLTYEVIARPRALSTYQGQYALDVGQELLAEMNNHTDYDFYSMSENLKMTQASVPDFSAGAMENWGLLIYREAYLMYDPLHTNSNAKQLIAYILSHEIAHMWFGNLVTCDWWDVLWLNEGFARYYQYFLTDWVETDMGFETRFITEQVHTALLSDSSNNPHPLTNPGLGSPFAIRTMFTTLTYGKGAAIIRMTEHLLGHDVHREGLRKYLREKEFSTALPTDLFTSLQEAGEAAGALVEYGPDFSLIDYYKSWTERGGHPVLEVHVNHQTGDMTIHQRRFNINSGHSNINTNWIIPISFYSASNPNFTDTKPTHIIRKTVTVINRGSIGNEWVVFNKKQTGFYRVNYDSYTWDLITDVLRGPLRTQIHEYNRAQIVNDVFQFARSELMTYDKAFNILSFLEFETDYAPWVAAMTGFTWLRNRLTGTEFLDRLEGLINDWSDAVMSDLTYYPTADPEDFMRSYLRYQLAPVRCQLNRDNCRQEAVNQFNNLKNNGQEVPPDSRNWVYCNALREGEEEDFNFLRTRFIEHNVYTEKILLLTVLGCTPHVSSLHQFLEDIIMPNDIVRPQDYNAAFNSAVSGNEENTQIVFEWVQNNLPAVVSAFQIFREGVTTPMSYISARLRTVEQVNEFQQWASDNANAFGTTLGGDPFPTVFNGAEAARQSIAWTATVTADISNYLENGFQEITSTSPAPVTTPVPPVIENRPDLEQPQTPDLPGSAVNAFLSVSVLCFAAMFNFIL